MKRGLSEREKFARLYRRGRLFDSRYTSGWFEPVRTEANSIVSGPRGRSRCSSMLRFYFDDRRMGSGFAGLTLILLPTRVKRGYA